MSPRHKSSIPSAPRRSCSESDYQQQATWLIGFSLQDGFDTFEGWRQFIFYYVPNDIQVYSEVEMGCTPDITSQIRENDGLGKKTKSFPSDCSESKIEG
jgi:hypothetical protein